MSEQPGLIIDQMMNKDRFSQWLGIERTHEGEGYCSVQLMVREDMCNGFSITHGGITYSLADTAMAFAANTFGHHAVSVESSIAYFIPVHPGEMIYAHARLLSKTKTIAHYEVRVENEKHEMVAFFKGCLVFKKESWDV